MRPIATIAALALLASACSEPEFIVPTAATPPPIPATAAREPAQPTFTETFAGTLSARGVRFYAFTVLAYGTVRLTLETLQNPQGAVAAMLELGLGAPSGTGCTVSVARVSSASETPQIMEILEPGVYCARVADHGALTSEVDFSVRIDFP
jgi:hypothetical protein